MANEEEGLRPIVSQIETAWNNSDSKAFAEPFAEDADFIRAYRNLSGYSR